MAIIQTPADSGNGGGFTAAQGAVNPTISGGTCIVTNMNTEFMISDFFDLHSTQYNPSTHGSIGSNIFGGNSGSNFAFHTGHNANSSNWPCYFAIHLTDHSNGMIVNRCFWSKHTNMCGNVDFWGTMKHIGDHTGSSWYNTANYTNLGRAHFGGVGSGSERGNVTASFNSSSYGYRWILMIIQDINASVLSYPSVGTLGGWAAYGLQIGKA